MAISALTLAKADLLTQRLFSRRDLIPPQTDSLWRIERGAIRTVTWSEEGTLRALGYWGPGDIVGHPLSRIKPYQIECLTSVEMSRLPSSLWYQALEPMLKRMQQIEELISIIHRHPVGLRLWGILSLVS